ncbi:MAG: prenyltransferase [Candidatus Aenigmarchaeota archaeon]|nr:prenyltransferase [Candidatus Aenigmarchaeota archaeon]
MSLAPWLRELRLPFLAASILPVLLGGSLVFAATGTVDLVLFLLTLAAMVCLHLGANVANEYFDFRSGTDVVNTQRTPFSGGTGLLPTGQLKPVSVHRLSLAFFAAGSLIGLSLVALRGLPVLVLGLVGLVSGYCYTAPQLNFARRGLGELLVGFNFGVLPVLGTVLVLTGALSLPAVLASLPLAFLITAVLYVNQFPDYEADKQAGKRHLVVRLGRARAVRGYELLLVGAYLSLGLAIAVGALPLLAGLTFLTLPLAGKAARNLRAHHSTFPAIIPSNALTVLAHLAAGIILAVTVAVAPLW